MFWRMSMVFLQIEKEKQQPRSDFFEEMKNNHIFKGIFDENERVGQFSDTNLEHSKKREQADIFSRHITCGMCVGLLLVSSSRFSRTCILKSAVAPRFRFVIKDIKTK